ncbi:7-carboxy-7-deazaguanine synthase QueE [Almyronema epifaneia]|uniref:7-carboxy-7-deazaguanine synthase n=1 Tax=Almyronema epifaneia S1 TaxID=2991925 RepID=A0ABW6I9D3_9CYAN
MKTIEATQTTLYPVVEVFHSLQGEGVWSGTSAWFIRLGGCDVGCWFCDTKASWNSRRHPQQTVQQITQTAAAAAAKIVVITGGEPLLHDLAPLSASLQAHNLKVHLETSGAHPLSGRFDWVTCSPKPFKPPHASVYPHVDELKVVISQPADFTWAEQQAIAVPPTAVKLLQPEWGTPESAQLVFDYVRCHPDWRLSLQTHKFLGIQ